MLRKHARHPGTPGVTQNDNGDWRLDLDRSIPHSQRCKWDNIFWISSYPNERSIGRWWLMCTATDFIFRQTLPMKSPSHGAFREFNSSRMCCTFTHRSLNHNIYHSQFLVFNSFLTWKKITNLWVPLSLSRIARLQWTVNCASQESKKSTFYRLQIICTTWNASRDPISSDPKSQSEIKSLWFCRDFSISSVDRDDWNRYTFDRRTSRIF